MVQDTNSLSMIGGALAALVAGTLLVATKYSRTWLPLCHHSRAFWAYVAGYGALGYAVTAIVFRTPAGTVPSILNIPTYIFWPVAIAFIGTLAKASVVGAMPGADQFHMTVRSALLLFEPGLLQQIEIDEFFALKIIARKYSRSSNTPSDHNWTDLQTVKEAIRQNIPDRLKEEKRLLFLGELEKCLTVEEAMIHYIRLVSPRWFKFVFDDGPPARPVLEIEPGQPLTIQTTPRKSPKSMHATLAADLASQRPR